MDDATLMERVARGERQAVAAFYARFRGPVYRYVYPKFRSEADDITQGVLIAAWRRAKTFDPKRGKLTAWVMGIARNRVIDAIRHASARPQPGPLEFPHGDPSYETPLPTDAPQEARAALKKMNPGLRRIIVAVAWGGYRGASIAEGMPVGTVKSGANRAVKQARR